MSEEGGHLVPPQFIEELLRLERDRLERERGTSLGIRPDDDPDRWARERAERWAAMSRRERMRARFRARVLGPLRARRRTLGMRIAGLTENDLGGDW